MGDRPHQLTLNRQQLLQVLGHAIESCRQPPDRVCTASGYAHFQVALGDTRSRRLKTFEPALKLTHQQIDDQADQSQADQGDQDQPLRRVRVHLVQRADLQYPRGADHAGKHANRIAALAQRHHRIALRHATTLVVVHVGLVKGHQVHFKTKTLGVFDVGQALGLFGHRETHQFVGQQVNSRTGQLLADLLHFAGEHQLLLLADQPQHPRRMRPGLLNQDLAALQAVALAQVQLRIGERAQL